MSTKEIRALLDERRAPRGLSYQMQDGLVDALCAVLDLCEDPGGPDSWSFTFDERHGLFADDVLRAIGEHLCHGVPA